MLIDICVPPSDIGDSPQQSTALIEQMRTSVCALHLVRRGISIPLMRDPPSGHRRSSQPWRSAKRTKYIHTTPAPITHARRYPKHDDPMHPICICSPRGRLGSGCPGTRSRPDRDHQVKCRLPRQDSALPLFDEYNGCVQSPWGHVRRLCSRSLSKWCPLVALSPYTSCD